MNLNGLYFLEDILYFVMSIIMCFYSIEEIKKDWKNRENDYSTKITVHAVMIVAFAVLALFSLFNLLNN